MKTFMQHINLCLTCKFHKATLFPSSSLSTPDQPSLHHSTGNELTPGVKYDFKFKDYAPWVFRNLRESFKIDPADYMVAIFV
jgi:hypothetical protein